MSIVVRVIGLKLFHEHETQVFGQKLFHEHDSANIRSETLSRA